MSDKKKRSMAGLPWIAAMAFFMQALDATILNTALPAIAHSLNRSPLAMQSAIISYTLTVAMLIPVSGWLADRFGRRPSGQSFGRRVQACDAPFRIRRDDGIADRLEGHAQQFVLPFQLARHAPALGHVLECPHQPLHLKASPALDHAHRTNAVDLSIRTGHVQLKVKRIPGVQGAGQGLLHALSRVRRVQRHPLLMPWLVAGRLAVHVAGPL